MDFPQDSARGDVWPTEKSTTAAHNQIKSLRPQHLGPEKWTRLLVSPHLLPFLVSGISLSKSIFLSAASSALYKSPPSPPRLPLPWTFNWWFALLITYLGDHDISWVSPVFTPRKSEEETQLKGFCGLFYLNQQSVSLLCRCVLVSFSHNGLTRTNISIYI